MNRFVLLICLINFFPWTAVESAPQLSDSNEVINDGSEVGSDENEPAVTESLFTVKTVLKKAKGDEHQNFEVSGNDDDHILKLNKNNEDIVIDFKYSFSLLTKKDRSSCILNRISNFLDYETVLNHLETEKSELTLDYAVCQYSLLNESSLSDFGESVEQMCSSEETFSAELINCHIISPTDDSFTPYPMEVLAKTYKSCLDVVFVCDYMEDCSLVCINAAIFTGNINEGHHITIGTENGQKSYLRTVLYDIAAEGHEIIGFYGYTYSWSDQLDYIGTMYLDINNDIAIAVNAVAGQCAAIKLPDETTLRQFTIDVPEDQNSIAPIINCRLDKNIDSERISSSELFNVACKDIIKYEVHDCEFVPEEDVIEGYPCQFLAPMYFEHKSGLYCIQKETSIDEVEETEEKI